MSEPDYLRQNGGLADLTYKERQAWFVDAHREAEQEGCTWFRYSTDHKLTDGIIGLVEAWKTRPDDQGEIRWQLTNEEIT